MLDSAFSQEHISYMERLLGQNEQQSNNISSELINDMRLASHYPPIVQNKLSGMELAEIANGLVDHIALKKKTGSDDVDDLFDFD